MKCVDVQMCVLELRDAQKIPESLADHLEGCARCRDFLRSTRLVQSIHSKKIEHTDIVTPNELRARTLERGRRIVAEKNVNNERDLSGWMSSLWHSTATVLCLCVCFLLFLVAGSIALRDYDGEELNRLVQSLLLCLIVQNVITALFAPLILLPSGKSKVTAMK
jgi:hypothetical protein